MQRTALHHKTHDADLNNLGNGLIVTRNDSAILTIGECLKAYGISLQVCRDAASCLRSVARNRFEVVFVDFSLGDEAEVAVEHVRSSASSKSAVVIAVTQNTVTAKRSFAAGATFEIQEPVLSVNLKRLLRAAYGMILRERRRYFRCNVSAAIRGSRGGAEPPWQGTLVNISESGLCLVAPVRLATGDPLNIEMTLPASDTRMAAQCEVLWADASSRVGLRFVKVDPSAKSDLGLWLTDRLEAAQSADRKTLTLAVPTISPERPEGRREPGV